METSNLMDKMQIEMTDAINSLKIFEKEFFNEQN